jgi:superfamily II DNA or RNA helicase
VTTQVTVLIPAPGEIVRVRQRQYLVEDVLPSAPGEATLVAMSCLDDDEQGEPLDVLWEHEIDAEVVAASWDKLGRRGFDASSRFAAYLHTLRWNCVTATNPRLFQSPWRAGIEVMAYQLEPLRKALRLPRVNLFIADDVGLGKTIEAGLVLREMLMRQRVRRVVVAAPPSVALQWRDELEQRFGLTFVIYDRDFVASCRRERGYGVNPWTTHSRFIISHALLRDEEYATPLRDVLGDFDPGSMLILDEAHHAAPASSSKYAIDSQLTRAVRELARRFEHRLFLSATPHNGLSNSFSALLEILDPQRFCRGVRVEPKVRDEVMVRRLKSDLREISSDFPDRQVLRVPINGLPADAPELELASLLDRYWELRDRRLAGLPTRQRTAQGLVLVNLQKRLFSSIEAFSRTLKAHRRALDRASAGAAPAPVSQASLELLAAAPGPEDDRAELPEEQVEEEEEQAVEAATATGTLAPTPAEFDLVARMEEIAERTRRLPDARVRWLVDWLRSEMCPGLPPLGMPATGAPAGWEPKRVLIFTEYADTKRYLEQQLKAAVGATSRGDERIASFHGGLPDELREAVKRSFNADPEKDPLRILIATDAAREGVNLQNYCADLFHFDLPWNPSRLEQRNGRIDRKLQRAPEVRCRYFIYEQREADRVLEVLAERTKTISDELGSMPPVLAERLTQTLEGGIAPGRRAELVAAVREQTTQPTNEQQEEELESSRARKAALQKQLDELRNILEASRRSLDLNEGQLRHVLSESLEMLGAPPLQSIHDPLQEAYSVPALDQRAGADPTWVDTLDTLRSPRPPRVPLWEWRRSAPIRPVVFKDPGHIDNDVVHLHLEHRLVRRLLGRFLAQGFVLDDLARACAGQSDDAIPRVLLLGRLSLYGDHAARLHDEIVPIAARWVDPTNRAQPLRPYGEDIQEKSWDLLLAALSSRKPATVPGPVQQRLLATTPRDVDELLPHLNERCALLAAKATAALEERGRREARDMVEILEGQRRLIERVRGDRDVVQLPLFSDEERRQLEANRRYWERRLDAISHELTTEPARIENSYAVRTTRIEPVGVAYLWPVSG